MQADVTIKQMRAFDAVVRAGSVQQAAAEMRLTQPAVTIAIQAFEAVMGLELFHRRQGRLTPNEDGRRLHAKVKSILTMSEEMQADARNQPLQGTLKIGAATTIGNYIMPGVCASFIAAHPDVRIEMVVAPSTQILEEVDNINLDLGFVESPNTRPTIESRAWFDDRLIIFAGRKHRLAKRRRLRLASLEDETWLVQRRGSTTRNALLPFVLESLTTIRIGLETDSLEAIKKTVALGDAIGCLSRSAIERELAAGELVALDVADFRLSRSYYAIVRKARYQGTAQAGFLKLAEAFVRKL